MKNLIYLLILCCWSGMYYSQVQNDSYTTAVDTDITFNPTGNDNTNSCGYPVAIAKICDPNGTSFTTFQGGTITVVSNLSLTYTPPVGFSGTDGFYYGLSRDTDTTCNYCDTGLITFIVGTPACDTARHQTSYDTICDNQVKQLLATPAGGTWTVVSGGGTISGGFYYPPTVSSGTIYPQLKYTISGDSSCTQLTTQVSFGVTSCSTPCDTASNNTNSSTICQGDTKQLQGSPAGGTWSLVSGSGSISGSTYVASGTIFSPYITVRYSIPQDSVCSGTFSDVTFIVDTSSNCGLSNDPCVGKSISFSHDPVTQNGWVRFDGVLNNSSNVYTSYTYKVNGVVQTWGQMNNGTSIDSLNVSNGDYICLYIDDYTYDSSTQVWDTCYLTYCDTFKLTTSSNPCDNFGVTSIVPDVSQDSTYITVNATANYTVTSYIWQVNGTDSGNGATATLLVNIGDVVCLEAIGFTVDNNGDTTVCSAYICDTLLPDPVVDSGCNLASDFTSTTNGLTASFTNTTSVITPGTTFTWDFGDGNSSSVINPTHTYAASGTYIVRLEANEVRYDSLNQTWDTCYSYSCYLVSVYGQSNDPCLGKSISFSHDPVVQGGLVRFDGVLNNSSNVYTSYTYKVNGVVQTWGQMNNGTSIDSLSVSNGDYVCLYIEDYTYDSSTQVWDTCYLTFCDTFEILSSTDSCDNLFASISHSPFAQDSSYGTVTVNLSGYSNSNYQISGFTSMTNQQFFNSGDSILLVDGDVICAEIVATFIDSSGNSFTCIQTVCDTVTKLTDTTLPDPIIDTACNLAADYTYTENGLTVSFTNTTSVITAGTYFEWNFGDGNTSFVQDPTHTYAAPGSYIVRLDAHDVRYDSVNQVWDTCYSYACYIITVDNPVVSFNCDSASANFSKTISGQTVSFVANAVGFTNASYFWNFGDGAYDNSSANPTHTYGADGTYSVCLTVMEKDGACDIVCVKNICYDVTINVNDPCQGNTATFTYFDSANFVYFNSQLYGYGFGWTTPQVNWYINGNYTGTSNVLSSGNVLTGDTVCMKVISYFHDSAQSFADTCIIEYCDVISTSTSISQIGGAVDVKLFPNPAQSNITLMIETVNSVQTEMNVYDAIGNLVMVKQIELTNGKNAVELDINHIETGNYFISVIDKSTNSILTNKPFIKQ